MTTDTQDNRRDQLLHETLDVGDRAIALLRQFTREEIPSSKLQEKLAQTNAGDALTRYWDILTSNSSNAPCLEVLQLISSLDQELESQLLRYGESSLWDDLNELQTAVGRVRRMRLDSPSH